MPSLDAGAAGGRRTPPTVSDDDEPAPDAGSSAASDAGSSSPLRSWRCLKRGILIAAPFVGDVHDLLRGVVSRRRSAAIPSRAGSARTLGPGGMVALGVRRRPARERAPRPTVAQSTHAQTATGRIYDDLS